MGLLDWAGSFFGGGGGGGLSDIASPEATQGAYQGFSPGGQYDISSVGAGSGGGGGFGDWLGKLGSGFDSLGSAAKSAAPLIGLGTTAMGIYGGIKQQQQAADQMKVLQQQQRQQQAMAAPAAQAGGALTQAGAAALQGGALPPALEAQVEDWKNRARMQYKQMLASQGMTDSTAALQYDAWLETQAQKLRGDLAGGLYGQGLQGLGTALGPSATVSQTAMGLAGGTHGSIEAANKALHDLLGGQ